MGRKASKLGEAGGSGTDIMTSLIGCLILILLGILMIIFVSQILVIITEPDNKDILSVVESKVDGFRESKAFPDGNLEKEPTYIDVYQNRVVIHPNKIEIPQRELYQRQNRLTKVLDSVMENEQNEYVILLVRPRSTGLQRHIQDMIKKNYRMDIGIELFESAREVEHVSSTRERLMKLKESAEKAAADARALGGKARKPEK